MSKALDEALRYLTPRALITILSFVLLAQLGLRFQAPIAELLAQISFHGSVLITDANLIYSLWIGLLSVHAAVGAVAPILGYTLMATTISSASRIAPSGAVVAAEIKWSNYLQTSLALLAGSLVGLLSAPSALGLAAAAFSTTYVVLRTLYVFKQGFELIERPEKFDIGARKYLTRAVADVPLMPPGASLKVELETLNSGLNGRVPRAAGAPMSGQTLRLGNPFRATQLLRVEPRAIDVLLSEAEKLGCQLFLRRTEIPHYLARGARDFIEVRRVGEAKQTNEATPPDKLASAPIDTRALQSLQRLFESSVSFGRSQWIDDFTRLPMLIQRHIATVVYESIPREQPHDLTYGLDVLGQLIDEIQSRHGGKNPFDLDVFDWVYDIPLFLCNQIESACHSRLLYARELVNFLRARLAIWLIDPSLDSLSQAYIRLIARLLNSFLGSDSTSAEYLALVIREIPALSRSRRLESIIFVQRALITVLVGGKDGGVHRRKDRRLLVRTMAEVLRYSPGYDKDGVARAETVASAVAVTLYLASEREVYQPHVAEVTELLVSDRYSDLPFIELIDLIRRVSEVSDRWKWSWWELEQKEGGEAHWMSMELWLQRAAIVALSSEGWRLAHLDDEHVPDQQVLASMLRAIGTDDGWVNLLPDATRRDVLALVAPLNTLSDRRGAMVAERVAATPLDFEKVKSFVSETVSDIRKIFGAHNKWLAESGSVTCELRVDEGCQAGTSRLLSRELFVPDATLDIPIMLATGSLVGRALVDFELRKIIAHLHRAADGGAQVASATDPRVWDRVVNMIDAGATRVLVVGVGVSEYDVFEQLNRIRALADQRQSSFRFETLRSPSASFEGVFVADAAKAFKIARLQLGSSEAAVYEKVLPLEEGGVVSGISEITPQMCEEWLRGESFEESEKLRKRYAESVLDRTSWSFRVEAGDPGSCTFFTAGEAVNNVAPPSGP